MKKTYQFTILLGDINENTPNVEDSLYEAGCDDALINFKNGAVYLDFDREGYSLEQTIISAINDIESSNVKPTVLSVAPEHLVSLSDIASRLSITRQAMSLYMLGERGSGNFPKPILKINNKSSLWKWSDITQWFYKQGKINDDNIIKEAHAVEDINAALELRNPQTFKHRKQILAQFIKQA